MGDIGFLVRPFSQLSSQQRLRVLCAVSGESLRAFGYYLPVCARLYYKYTVVRYVTRQILHDFLSSRLYVFAFDECVCCMSTSP